MWKSVCPNAIIKRCRYSNFESKDFERLYTHNVSRSYHLNKKSKSLFLIKKMMRGWWSCCFKRHLSNLSVTQMVLDFGIFQNLINTNIHCSKVKRRWYKFGKTLPSRVANICNWLFVFYWCLWLNTQFKDSYLTNDITKLEILVSAPNQTIIKQNTTNHSLNQKYDPQKEQTG